MIHVAMGFLVAGIVFALGALAFIFYLIFERAPVVAPIAAGLIVVGTIAAVADWYTEKRSKEKADGPREGPPVPPSERG
jgi:hypothetical protein